MKRWAPVKGTFTQSIKSLKFRFKFHQTKVSKHVNNLNPIGQLHRFEFQEDHDDPSMSRRQSLNSTRGYQQQVEFCVFTVLLFCAVRVAGLKDTWPGEGYHKTIYVSGTSSWYHASRFSCSGDVPAMRGTPKKNINLEGAVVSREYNSLLLEQLLLLTGMEQPPRTRGRRKLFCVAAKRFHKSDVIVRLSVICSVSSPVVMYSHVTVSCGSFEYPEWSHFFT